VHVLGIDKNKLANSTCPIDLNYDSNTPYLLAYDYLLTHINWFVKEKLGSTARGMLIIDAKEQYHPDIEKITRFRRFEGTAAHRVKWIVEFSYPVDSQKNPMVQLSDLVVFCTKKFFEVELGYRDAYPDEAKTFFAECYQIIDSRIPRKTLVVRDGRNMDKLHDYLASVKAIPARNWKKKYRV
jgi:hypothetical protein